MSKKLPVNGFKWIEDSKLSEFNKGFIKNYDENSNIGYILEVDVEHPTILLNSHRDLPFLPERREIRGVEKLICSIVSCSHKIPKTSTKSRINTKRSTQSNSI